MQSAGFPLLERGYDGSPIIYLDSASTTPKPRSVISAVTGYYESSARTCTAACIRLRKARRRNTSARGIASRR